ncbi:uncharacterized serine-rich protein C215.13-like [Mercurialis annua]|uniref:uncharacterized serine-rich protein C215.13-like n=1 Tax=Mercurialis annua TaxID=3986 RepID=UPI00215DE105|nr:uncharacterized serine-rich protein C215.13-like [Mercurialis annua]
MASSGTQASPSLSVTPDQRVGWPSLSSHSKPSAAAHLQSVDLAASPAIRLSLYPAASSPTVLAAAAASAPATPAGSSPTGSAASSSRSSLPKTTTGPAMLHQQLGSSVVPAAAAGESLAAAATDDFCSTSPASQAASPSAAAACDSSQLFSSSSTFAAAIGPPMQSTNKLSKHLVSNCAGMLEIHVFAIAFVDEVNGSVDSRDHVFFKFQPLHVAIQEKHHDMNLQVVCPEFVKVKSTCQSE